MLKKSIPVLKRAEPGRGGMKMLKERKHENQGKKGGGRVTGTGS